MSPILRSEMGRFGNRGRARSVRFKVLSILGELGLGEYATNEEIYTLGWDLPDLKCECRTRHESDCPAWRRRMEATTIEGDINRALVFLQNQGWVKPIPGYRSGKMPRGITPAGAEVYQAEVETFEREATEIIKELTQPTP